MRTTKLCVLVLCSLAFACGEVVKATDGGNDPARDGGVDRDGNITVAACDRALESPANLTECFTHQRCQWALRCTARYASHEQCVEASATDPEIGYINLYLGLMLVEGAEAGAFTIDEATFDRCIDSFASASCKSDDVGGEDCPLAFEGQRRDGETCYSELECGRGGRCERDSCGFGMCCPGVCRLPVAEGQACDDLTRCEAGLHCVGGRCESGEVGAPCGADRECDPTLHCDGTCQPSRGEGDVCDRDRMCAGDLQCVEQHCERTSEDGDPCNDDCYGPFYCDGAEGRCRPVAAAPGADCSAGQVCLGADLYCSEATGRCEAMPGLDEPCNPRGRCGIGLVCAADSNAALCAEPLANGEPCDRSSRCASFHCEPATSTCEDLDSCY